MADNKTIQEEAGLGPNWVPVDAAPIIPGVRNQVAAPGFASVVETVPKYNQGSIAPNFQHDSSFTDTKQPSPSHPQFDLMPIGLQNAVSSSQISGTAKVIVENTPVSIVDVDFYQSVQSSGTTLPQEEILNFLFPLSAKDDTGKTDVLMNIGINPQPFGPLALAATSSGTGVTATASGTVVGANQYVFSLTSSAAGANSFGSPGAGWTSIGYGNQYDMAAAAGPITATQTQSGSHTWAQLLYSLTTTGTPVFSSGGGFSGSNPGQGNTTAMGGYTITAGVTALIVTMQFHQGTPGFYTQDLTLTISDTMGLTYYFIGGTQTHPSEGAGVFAWIAFPTSTGSNTTSFTQTSSNPNFFVGIEAVVYQATNVSGIGSGTYDIVSTDLGKMIQFTGLDNISAVLPTPPYAGWWTLVANDTSNLAVTLTATSGAINGGVSVPVPFGQSTFAVTDGTNWFTNNTGAAPYSSIEYNGAALPQEPNLNFLSPLKAVDNKGNNSTDVSAPAFVASGSSHAAGSVPDPGSTAGTTRFLREDATWVTVGATVQVLVDFGFSAGNEGDLARATVTGLSWVTANSILVCSPAGKATTDHDPEDAAIDGIMALVENIVAGTGFDIVAKACGDSGTTWGKYYINVTGA